jgi:hypothetical protein
MLIKHKKSSINKRLSKNFKNRKRSVKSLLQEAKQVPHLVPYLT